MYHVCSAVGFFFQKKKKKKKNSKKYLGLGVYSHSTEGRGKIFDLHNSFLTFGI